LLLFVSCGASDDEPAAGPSSDERISSVLLPPDIVMLSLGVDISRPDLASARRWRPAWNC
jgi:hypothetical protein